MMVGIENGADVRQQALSLIENAPEGVVALLDDLAKESRETPEIVQEMLERMGLDLQEAGTDRMDS